MYILSQKRENTLKALFSDDAWSSIDELFDDKRTITEIMKQAYIDQIKQFYQREPQPKRFHKLKKSRPSLPYSIFMINDEPFLVLPTPEAWKIKHPSNAIPKTLVSLTTGELKFLKTYRPDAFLGDKYPEDASTKDFNNREQWGEVTEHLKRSTVKGNKYYLLMPHYGRSLDAFEKDASITPRLILSALAQAADHLKIWHDKGLLHLDIKPSNIMYDSNTEKGRLIDFENMLSDGQVVSMARGTQFYMHPERLMYDGKQWVPKTGNIRCCKNEDVFSFLRTIEDMLVIALKKEYKPTCKGALSYALRQFRDLAYCQFAADGTGTHAYRLNDIPPIETVIMLMAQTFERYDNIALDAVPKFEPVYQHEPPMPAPLPKPAIKPTVPAPSAPPSPKLHYGYPSYANNPSPRPNYGYQAYANNPSPRPNYGYQAYANNPPPRPNYGYQAYANNPSPRPNYAYQAYRNNPSPRPNYGYQAYANPPSPRLNHPYNPRAK